MPLESFAETSESIQEERVRDCIGLHAAVKNWPEMTVRHRYVVGKIRKAEQEDCASRDCLYSRGARYACGIQSKEKRLTVRALKLVEVSQSLRPPEVSWALKPLEVIRALMPPEVIWVLGSPEVIRAPKLSEVPRA
jgi:hypothetical protein